MDEAEVMYNDGAVALTLGGEKVEVKPLNVQSSFQWTKRVRRLVAEQAKNNMGLLNMDGSLEDKFKRVMEVLESPQFVQDGELYYKAMLEYNSKVLTPEVVNKATAVELTDAFITLWKIENPFQKVREVLQT